MAVISRNTFTVHRLAKPSFEVIFNPETIAIPTTSEGVADLTNAEWEVIVKKDGKEVFPNYDEGLEGRNYWLGSSGFNRIHSNSPQKAPIELGTDEIGNWISGLKLSTNEFYVSGYIYPKLTNTNYFTENLSNSIVVQSLDVMCSEPIQIGLFYNAQQVIETNKWVRIENTYNSGDRPRGIWSINNSPGIPLDTKIYFKNWKIEKVDNATGLWTPAPEDILNYAQITTHNCSVAVVDNKLKVTTITPGARQGYADVTISYGEGFTQTKRFTWVTVPAGQKGVDGISVTGVDVEFGTSTHAEILPETWSTTAPTLTGDKQLWTRTKTTYSTGNPSFSNPVNVTPKTGAVGQGVESITEEFALSDFKGVQPEAGWSEEQPAWVPGKYIWSRVKVVLKNPAETYYTGYSVSSEWEAVNRVQVGGRNLLREYVLQFGGKYWGNQVEFIEVDTDDLGATPFLTVTPDNVQWVYPEHEEELTVQSNTNWNIN